MKLILNFFEENNIPIEKIKIATSHKDDPRFGVLMINPKDVMKNIDKYKSFKVNYITKQKILLLISRENMSQIRQFLKNST